MYLFAVSPGGGLRFGYELQAAEAAVALLIIDNSFEQVNSPEVRPESVGHVNLGVGALPQEKIRDAQLAARPHQQIQIGEIPGIEFLFDPGFVEFVNRLALLLELRRRRATSIDNFRATAIVQGDTENHSGVRRSPFRSPRNFLADT